MRKFLVFPPAIASEPKNLQFNLRSTINSGLFGSSTTECNSQIILEKDVLYAGDVVNVRIICDNSQCAKDVWGFEVSLLQYVRGRTNCAIASAEDETSKSQYLVQVKEHGECPAGSTTDRTFQF